MSHLKSLRSPRGRRVEWKMEHRPAWNTRALAASPQWPSLCHGTLPISTSDWLEALPAVSSWAALFSGNVTCKQVALVLSHINDTNLSGVKTTSPGLRSSEPFPSLQSKTDPPIPSSIFPSSWELCVLQPKEYNYCNHKKSYFYFSKALLLLSLPDSKSLYFQSLSTQHLLPRERRWKTLFRLS